MRTCLTAVLAALIALPAAAQEVSAQRLSDMTRELASDAYAGRGPGGPGEQKTVDFIAGQFKALGLTPAGDNGGWTQAVPLYRYQTKSGGKFSLSAGGKTDALELQRDLRIETQRPVETVKIDAAPLVFVGYGVTAPERGWDDFKGADLKGKIALILINDPDFEAAPGDAVAGKFGGKAATYYARWVYKYEEAVRRGALGALIIHETAGAAYGWNTVIASNGESYDVVRADPAKDKLLLQGWIAREHAVSLFQRAGLDFETEKAKAKTAAFKPVQLKGASFSANYANSFEKLVSHNVLAVLPGSKRPTETVSFAAHWDAYGIGPADASGATIRSGAIDDAVGVAGVIEVARALKAGPAPERSVLFAAWTAEERGLLGSEYFAQNASWPIGKMVANFTLDVLQTGGLSRDVVLVGSGQNQLEDLLKAAAAKQGRTVTPDPRPDRALFYRADHFSLAKRGVPTVLLMGLGGGADLVKGGRAAGEAWVQDYTARCYHQICDRWAPDQDYAGAAQDTALVLDVGRALANSRDWPDWNDGSEFKPVRAQTAAERR